MYEYKSKSAKLSANNMVIYELIDKVSFNNGEMTWDNIRKTTLTIISRTSHILRKCYYSNTSLELKRIFVLSVNDGDSKLSHSKIESKPTLPNSSVHYIILLEIFKESNSPWLLAYFYLISILPYTAWQSLSNT